MIYIIASNNLFLFSPGYNIYKVNYSLAGICYGTAVNDIILLRGE